MPKETFLNLDEEKKQRIIAASISEFAAHTYQEVKLSRIIKQSGIPRGSFYQYFEDKKDLYIFILGKIAEEKMKYLDILIKNPGEVSFLTLFRELYKAGLAFALENPQYVLISKHLMMTKGDIFNELMGDNLDIAKNYYISWIEADKKLGRIRTEVDSSLLADIVIQTTTNIAFDELSNGQEINPENMLNRLEGIIKILQKGIE